MPCDHHHGEIHIEQDRTMFRVWRAHIKRAGHAHPLIWPTSPGGSIVCDDCGRGWVGVEWPTVMIGQQRIGTYLRVETRRERRRRITDPSRRRAKVKIAAAVYLPMIPLWVWLWCWHEVGFVTSTEIVATYTVLYVAFVALL